MDIKSLAISWLATFFKVLKRYSSKKTEAFKSHLNANWPSCFEESSIYKTKINHSDIRSTIYHVHTNYWNTATLLLNKLYDKHINSLHECILIKAPCFYANCNIEISLQTFIKVKWYVWNRSDDEDFSEIGSLHETSSKIET